jgi:prepilin-type N-terminal cleavage/methylation domain-containing protein
MSKQNRAAAKGKRAEGGRSAEQGFTIVELMIATAVFSVVLLLCATGIVQVGRTFYKGTIVNKTQDNARQVADDIGQAIQFGPVATNFYQVATTTYPYGAGNVNVNSLCLGTVRYSYSVDRSLGSDAALQLTHVLWKDHIALGTACTPLNISQSTPGGSSADGQELLGDNMRIPTLTVPNTPANGLWNITLVVSYGDSDLFVGGSNYSQCVATNGGGQFCASSTINTHVTKRL